MIDYSYQDIITTHHSTVILTFIVLLDVVMYRFWKQIDRGVHLRCVFFHIFNIIFAINHAKVTCSRILEF